MPLWARVAREVEEGDDSGLPAEGEKVTKVTESGLPWARF